MIVTLSVDDIEALWAAAAGKVIASVPEATLDDVIDMVGPSEDPSIADCIAILTSPVAIPGCALDDFQIEKHIGVEPTTTVSDLVPARPSRIASQRPAVNDQRDTRPSFN